MFQKVISIAVVAFLSMAGAALAQSGPPLTDAGIKGFIASLPQVAALGDKYGVEPETETAGPPDFSKMYIDAIRRMRARGGYNELRSLLRGHGFSSPESWANVAGRVMKAFMGLSMEGSSSQVGAQMQHMIRQMEKDPNIPPEQRAEIIKQMRASSSMMTSMSKKTPDWDKVRPHMPTLKAAMDSQ